MPENDADARIDQPDSGPQGQPEDAARQQRPAGRQNGFRDLQDYVRVKHAVAEIVQAGREAARSERRELADEWQELLVKLAEDRFNLAIVGEFKRGKSSLVNALLGRDLLPTGVLPLTSAITAIRYGSKDRVFLRRTGSTFEQEIRLDLLPEYVTERGNPGNLRGLIEARIEVPHSLLRRGLYVIDTPGVGSSRLENTETTHEFLPRADAVVFVTSGEAALSDAEEQFLGEITDHARRLFVVVNKMDTLAEPERVEVIGYVEGRLAEIFGPIDIRVFPLSARDALRGKLEASDEQVARSGILEFETALTSFLADEQGRTFLVSVLDRAVSLIERGDQAADGAAGRAASAVDDMKLHERATATRDRLLGDGLGFVARPVVARREVTSAATDAVIASARERASRPVPVVDPRSTCPVCADQADEIFAFFAKWQFTLATSEVARNEFRSAGGFCPAHTWQFTQIASSEGMSVGYVPLIESIGEALRQTSIDQARPCVDVEALLATAGTCAACRVLRETEASAIGLVLAPLSTAEGRTAYQQREGLCLPHFANSLGRLEDEPTRAWLIRDQARRIEELAEDLRSYSLKRGAVRRSLLDFREEYAWRRAAVQLAGERVARGVVLPGHERM